MKIRFILIIMVSICLLGCASYGKVNVKSDSFNNTDVVTMKLRHEPEETYRGTEVTYTAEYKAGAFQKGTFYFVIRTRSRDLALKPDLTYRIDQQDFKLSLGDRHVDVKTSVTNSQSMVTGKTESSTSTSRKTKASVEIPETLINAMKTMKSISFRLYLGDQTLTYNCTPEQIEQLRIFAKTNQKKADA